MMIGTRLRSAGLRRWSIALLLAASGWLVFGVTVVTGQAAARAPLVFAFVFICPGLALVRLSQKLPGPFSAEEQKALAHRHADLLIAGLRADAAKPALSGPAMELADLRQMVQDSEI